jgi:hypothetical protein
MESIMSNRDLYDEDLCPDGICMKPVKNHHRAGNYRNDMRGICGGKIIRIYARYGPLDGFGEFSTWEEMCCTRCRWKKKLKLISKKYIKPKNEVWVKQKKKRKNKNKKGHNSKNKTENYKKRRQYERK